MATVAGIPSRKIGVDEHDRDGQSERREQGVGHLGARYAIREEPETEDQHVYEDRRPDPRQQSGHERPNV